MPQEISLESRDDTAISPDAWKQVVSDHPHLRLCEAAPSFTNPVTGEVISMGFHENDAEVYEDGGWQYALGWLEGTIRFNERTIRDSDSPMRQIVTDIVSALNADLVSDEGDVVDLNDI